MNNKFRFTMIGVLIAIATATSMLIFYFRANEQPCANYSYQDAVNYVQNNLKKSAYNEKPIRENSNLKFAKLCFSTVKMSSSKTGFPYIVPLCIEQSKTPVGYGEVYADCGLEWRQENSSEM